MNRTFSPIIVVVTFLTSLSGAAISPALADDPIVGTWEGTMDSSSTILTFTSATSGTFESPSVPCGGTLSGGGSDGVYNYSETVTYGGVTETEAGCVGGSLRLVLQGDAMFYEGKVSYAGEEYYESGKFYRTSAAPAPPAPQVSCEVCGQALVSDIYYGLQQSAALPPYVDEAGSKYWNCVRDDPEECSSACVNHMLFRNLLTCDGYSDDGYRSCIEELFNGTQSQC